MNKDGLRSDLRRARRALTPAERQAETAAIVATLISLLDGPFASYAAVGGEVDLAGLHQELWDHGRTIFLPRVVEAGRLAWALVGGSEDLVAGSFGIPEPDAQRTTAIELPPGCRVLVPGVGFDLQGYRLGQGGGYYDRLLAQRPDLCTIGVGFACQLVAEIPREPHDQPVRGLVIAGRVVRDPRT